MDAPHFHHELVKRGVRIAMEKDGSDNTESGVSALDAIAALFSFLVKNAIVSEHQVHKGVKRLHKVLSDIQLDVPAAPSMLEEFEALAKEELPLGPGPCVLFCPMTQNEDGDNLLR